ncbi:Response regulator containing CheY-like receiver domain and AraC- domain [Thermobacillus xylanilyticus]|uniref:Response regulator containing CheY-like receiver domain and AraC- domain n=1 Tax=Thermobacillus xylanilyticus TaxID=76633 RepID=A0ABN7S4T5_THEXY|nr:response regulator [Thermobacillus xylanilyticus]CAG5092205.1 Response regulator containing CheY-like receiver domain and AraC- domain [Thermobacillus xylanilyticus]
MRILIVDDESGVRQMMADTVRRFDDSYEVEEAEEGEEALRMLDESFDLVITDIRMPGMDGVELASRIRERYPDIIIFMLTGYAEFEYARAAIRSNVSEYLLKPVSVQALREAIAKAADTVRGRKEAERISRLREMALLEKRVQDLLYELPLPYYDEWMFPEYDAVGVLSFVIEDAEEGGTIRFAVKNVLGDVLSGFGVPLVFVEGSHLTCVLFLKDGHASPEDIASRCADAVRATLRRTIRAGIGGVAKQLSEVSGLYWRSLKQLGIDRPAVPIAGDGTEQGTDGMLEPRGEMHHLIRQTIHILETEYDQDITLSGLAERLYLNPNYLSTLFKNETGTTFTQALLRIRMEKAKELLRTTKLKIYEVGSRVGYADSAHFSRVFKNHENMSPYEYREKYAQA